MCRNDSWAGSEDSQAEGRALFSASEDGSSGGEGHRTLGNIHVGGMVTYIPVLTPLSLLCCAQRNPVLSKGS